ncbi:membrane-spanning 4-domains subfamily A member 12-like [Astyanax mexicanus]|uniref:Membrane-spanning 4-domains subfamily A member 12-like n=1 Tax=Astyanax mexicanus TaxID=7994 RepID=A0A8T2M0D2_ASTMX|nr:membrane-spanning 4-domains subfamily A member 12-like [Astyanax mexicanus]
MSTTVIPTNNMENSFIILTQVIPAQSAPSGTGQNGPEPGAGFFTRPLSTTTGHDQDRFSPGQSRSFLKRETKVLGTVQIMMGIMSFLFSIVLLYETYMLLFTRSLHGFWGSAIYIFAGILSVVAENKYHPQLVKALLIVNAVSAVTAGTAVVLHSLDIMYQSTNMPCYDNNCNLYMRNGFSGALLVFSLLQFIVSICMLLFGLDASFCAEPTVCTSSQLPAYPTCCSLNNPIYLHRNEENMFVISNPNMDDSLLARPPPYNNTGPQFQQ